MKLKNIITSLLLVALAVGCTKEDLMPALKNIKVSQSYVTIKVDETDASKTTVAEITLTAEEAWKIEGIPAWLSVSPTSGEKGEHKLTFKNGTESYKNEELDINIVVGDETQKIKVIKKFEPRRLKVAEIAAADDSRPYFTAGTVISADAENESFVIDVEGTPLYIHRVVDEIDVQSVNNYEDGGDNDGYITVDGLGLVPGDILKVKGMKMAKPSDYEAGLTKVYIEEKTASLIVFDSKNQTEFTKEAADFTVKFKNGGTLGKLEVTAEEGQDWLKFVSTYQDEKDETTWYAQCKLKENSGAGARSAKITFVSTLMDKDDETKEKQTTTLSLTITQTTEAKPAEGEGDKKE